MLSDDDTGDVTPVASGKETAPTSQSKMQTSNQVLLPKFDYCKTF